MLFLWIVLGYFFLYVEIYTKGFSLLCFRGFVFLLMVFFLLIQIPYLLALLDIPSGGRLHVILFDEFVRGFCLWLWYIFYVLGCKGWILCSFLGDNFWNGGIIGCLSVGDMSVIIWPFSFLMWISKNGSSLKLCSMVNFILECRFWRKLCKSLMLLHGHFQNMKQSSMYLFYDLINSIFVLLLLAQLAGVVEYTDCYSAEG